MYKNAKKRCAEGDFSSTKKPKHTHTSADEHHDHPGFVRSQSPESDISEQPCDERNFTQEIRILKQHIENMEKEANAYRLHFEDYGNRIQSLEAEVHDRHTRLNVLQNKVDQLEAEAKGRRKYMEGFIDGVAKEKNSLVDALRQLLYDREKLIITTVEPEDTSYSLSTLFDTLQITTPQPIGDDIKPRRPCELVRREKRPHIEYFGYAVSQKWLAWFSKKFELDIRHIHVKSKEYFEGLAYLADIGHFGWEHCFNRNSGSVDGEEPDTVKVLYVYTNEWDSFQKCLVEKKIKAMTALLGHEPEWWVGCSSTSSATDWNELHSIVK
ncbi:hypothetical protein BDR04DRAFT_1164426 [Suillus decipiens]|nr:hypothetical protein BDR04DRAFT_1164426 [Suillus decipiens]